MAGVCLFDSKTEVPINPHPCCYLYECLLLRNHIFLKHADTKRILSDEEGRDRAPELASMSYLKENPLLLPSAYNKLLKKVSYNLNVMTLVTMIWYSLDLVTQLKKVHTVMVETCFDTHVVINDIR